MNEWTAEDEVKATEFLLSPLVAALKEVTERVDAGFGNMSRSLDASFEKMSRSLDRMEYSLSCMQSSCGGLAERHGSRVATTWSHAGRNLHGRSIGAYSGKEYGSVSSPVRRRIG